MYALKRQVYPNLGGLGWSLGSERFATRAEAKAVMVAYLKGKPPVENKRIKVVKV